MLIRAAYIAVWLLALGMSVLFAFGPWRGRDNVFVARAVIVYPVVIAWFAVDQVRSVPAPAPADFFLPAVFAVATTILAAAGLAFWRSSKAERA